MSKRESVWLADADAAVRPSLAGEAAADVLVVGAGIAGLTTALLMQLDGREVVVVEAGRVGRGSTGQGQLPGGGDAARDRAHCPPRRRGILSRPAEGHAS